MLIWSQSKGELSRFGSPAVLAHGYSGKGEGRNNPALESVRAVGPIPAGFWRIGKAYKSAKTGPVTIPVYKLDGNPGDEVDSVTGRSAFRIHGDNASGTASEGCIILANPARVAVDNGPDEILWVQA